jgi:FKBP-type peptidyl-prolyl cis-trans isomerase FklB
MKQLFVVVCCVAIVGCQQGADHKNVSLASHQDSVSYSIGMTIGLNLRRDSITVSPDQFLRGVIDAAKDTSQRMLSEATVQQCLTKFGEEMRDKKMAFAKAEGEKNRVEGEAFLAANGKKPGVVTLPSGLQYKVIKDGTGKRPLATSMVTTQYVGKFIDGREFDSSYKHGQAATFTIDHVIQGWSLALMMMKEGAKWEVYVPASLGYGDRGNGDMIPPNATLIFELELVSVN